LHESELVRVRRREKRRRLRFETAPQADIATDRAHKLTHGLLRI
jgi:hypothetical protein